jgi:hypothetical protein
MRSIAQVFGGSLVHSGPNSRTPGRSNVSECTTRTVRCPLCDKPQPTRDPLRAHTATPGKLLRLTRGFSRAHLPPGPCRASGPSTRSSAIWLMPRWQTRGGIARYWARTRWGSRPGIGTAGPRAAGSAARISGWRWSSSGASGRAIWPFHTWWGARPGRRQPGTQPSARSAPAGTQPIWSITMRSTRRKSRRFGRY